VCRRSSTSCGTCRHYRRSVAARIGYCGLDSRRQPLQGDEIRGCWEAAPVLDAPPILSGAARTGIDFVPVGEVAAPPPLATEPAVSASAGYGLFDLEP
jgi:hypothetical protein